MPTKTTLSDLRDHMFAAIEGLMDEDKPMDIERAKAIAEVGKRVIDSAKVEVDFMRVSGATTASRFFPAQPSNQLEGPKAQEAKMSPEQEKAHRRLFPHGELGDQ